jgi:hypothetical protein
MQENVLREVDSALVLMMQVIPRPRRRGRVIPENTGV